jgi:hypothetical protein
VGAQLGAIAHPPQADTVEGLLETRKHFGFMLAVGANSMVLPMGLFFMVLVLRVLLKRAWPAVVIMLAFTCLVSLLPTIAHFPELEASMRSRALAQLGIELAVSVVMSGMIFFVMIRLGLLALLSLYFFTSSWAAVSITFDTSSWLFGRSMFWLALLAAIAFWAQWNARAGRPLLRESFLQA